MEYFLFFPLILISLGCDVGSEPAMEEQSVKILYQHAFRDEVNTFAQTLTKDLVLDGTITVSFWLSRAEQDSILSEVNRLDFFNLPDTLKKLEGVMDSPDPSPDVLRIETEGREKSVVWNYPLDTTDPGTMAILDLTQTIRRIVESTNIYKHLPAPRGGYL